MKKRLLCVLVGLFLLAYGNNPAKVAQGGEKGEKTTAARDQSAISAPSLQIASKVFDFGKVDEGTVVTHSFTVKNVGTAVLHIKSVRPG